MQTWIILLGISFPLIGSIPVFLNVAILSQRDITPLTFAISNLIIAWGLLRYRLFDIHSLARDSIVENMRDGVTLPVTSNKITPSRMFSTIESLAREWMSNNR